MKFDKAERRLQKKIATTKKAVKKKLEKIEKNQEIIKQYYNILPTHLQDYCFLCLKKKPITVSHIMKSNGLLHRNEFDYKDYRNTFPACMDCHMKYEKLSGNPYKSNGRNRLIVLSEQIQKSKMLSMFFSKMVSRYKYILEMEGGEDTNPYDVFMVKEENPISTK